ncbi:MAG: hypothetical protein P1P77_12975 [Spirochaetaceae bacterium]|nr:hypothetical protein [Spirochaetaceae bacterium]
MIKKSFFDAWDNLGALILGNFSFFLVLMAGLWPMFRILESGNSMGFIFIVILIPILGITLGMVSSLQSKVADYKRPAWSDLPETFKSTWKISLVYSVSVALFFGISSFGITFYIGMKNMAGLTAVALLFWLCFGVYLLSLWFFPVRNRLSGNFRSLLKKSALIMLDNMGLTLFAGLIMVPLQFFLWPLTAFGAFGPAGILLYQAGTMRLLMLKYDWLEENPESKKRDVPWYELLIDEKELVGKRTLKGMIFPWKE